MCKKLILGVKSLIFFVFRAVYLALNFREGQFCSFVIDPEPESNLPLKIDSGLLAAESKQSLSNHRALSVLPRDGLIYCR